ncbi:hypothetical protein MENTO_v1c03300 [Mesoplasma entomophilum]|uniref:Uncharacterized protein n=1 Tax=Mesoplasma entomophilum TaxID=2149 RepID=A0A3S5XZK5_9MOLU|nr:hypothetical protein [Mesoplasma entomophilum]ATQ35476.1 hypothetical protein CS528_01705 [Mesoplasma entomophilum]ATZ19436.1 hypothetical protein MENTO_v1c03300 [Mesoplasma entomophilum]
MTKWHRFIPFINCALNNICILNGIIFNDYKFNFKIIKNLDFSKALKKFILINSLYEISENEIKNKIDNIIELRHLIFHPERKKKFNNLNNYSESNLIELLSLFLYKEQLLLLIENLDKSTNESEYLRLFLNKKHTQLTSSLNDEFLDRYLTVFFSWLNNNNNNGLKEIFSFSEELSTNKNIWDLAKNEQISIIINYFFKIKFNLNEKNNLEITFDYEKMKVCFNFKNWENKKIFIILNKITDIKKIKPYGLNKHIFKNKKEFTIEEYNTLINQFQIKKNKNILKLIFKLNSRKINCNNFNKKYKFKINNKNLKIIRNNYFHFCYLTDKDSEIISQLLYVIINFEDEDEKRIEKVNKIVSNFTAFDIELIFQKLSLYE